MRTSNNSPNSVYAAFTATFTSVPALVDNIAVDAPIVEDDEGRLQDYNGGATDGRNKTLDEVMFNVVSASLRKRYNSVNKVILPYCFETDNNQL